MELAPEQERKVREIQKEWEGLTDDELLDRDMKMLRPPLLETMAMNYEMERRGIPWERRIARQDKIINNVQMIKELVEQIYDPEQQDEKEQMIKALLRKLYEP